jgi:hypothetical protein
LGSPGIEGIGFINIGCINRFEIDPHFSPKYDLRKKGYGSEEQEGCNELT